MTEKRHLIGSVPVFDPVLSREPDAWMPMNGPAHLLVHLHHILRDIGALWSLREAQSDPELRALLLKLALVETHSGLRPFDALKRLVFRSSSGAPAGMAIGLRAGERETAKDLFGRSDGFRKRLKPAMERIRNAIGAHREHESWSEVLQRYDDLFSIEARLRDLWVSMAECVRFVSQLEVVEWARRDRAGNHHLIHFRFRPGDIEIDGQSPGPEPGP